jgi:diguanylate cyclase (GGDEF)-like protein
VSDEKTTTPKLFTHEDATQRQAIRRYQARSQFWFKLVVAVIILTPILTLWLFYSVARAQLEQDFRHLVVSITRLSAAAVDAEKHARIVEDGTSIPEYTELLGLLNDLEQSFPEIQGLATLVIKESDIYYTLDTTELSEVVTNTDEHRSFMRPYTTGSLEKKGLTELLGTGYWYSPELMLDANGAVQGACSRVRALADAAPTLLCLSVDANSYLDAVNALKRNSLLTVAAAIIATLILFFSVMQNHQHSSKWLSLIARQRDQYLTNSRTDPLTGALSRRAFDSAYAAAEAQFRRNKLPFALFYLDVDRFKQINDTHGHDVGDVLLHTLVDSLQHVLRPNDLLIRLGGDEFAIICNLAEREQALVIGEKLRDTASKIAIATPAGKLISPTLSLGVHLVGTNDTMATTQKHADEALYVAKRRGRNQVVCYSPDMEA